MGNGTGPAPGADRPHHEGTHIAAKTGPVGKATAAVKEVVKPADKKVVEPAAKAVGLDAGKQTAAPKTWAARKK